MSYEGEYQRFSYTRFRFEYELWCRYIQPFLDEHGIKDLAYDIGKNPGRNYDHCDSSEFSHALIDSFDTIKAILRLRDGGKSDVEIIVKDLREYIEGGFLPIFLENLDSVINKSSSYTAVEFPDITHLFELGIEEACKGFELIYIRYYIKQHGSISNAAAALKIPKKTLYSKLYRMREKTGKDSTPN
jgi:hypothetical protein